MTGGRWERGSGGTLEGRGLRELGAFVREGFENGAGAIRAVGQQDGERVFHRFHAEIRFAGVAVDAIEKRGEIDESVAGLDELKVEQLLLSGHGKRVVANRAEVNREGGGKARLRSRLRGLGRWCELPPCLRPTCMI